MQCAAVPAALSTHSWRRIGRRPPSCHSATPFLGLYGGHCSADSFPDRPAFYGKQSPTTTTGAASIMTLPSIATIFTITGGGNLQVAWNFQIGRRGQDLRNKLRLARVLTSQIRPSKKFRLFVFDHLRHHHTYCHHHRRQNHTPQGQGPGPGATAGSYVSQER